MRIFSILGLTFTCTLNAVIITQDLTLADPVVHAAGSLPGTELNEIAGNFNASYDFTFDQFDASLGTLTAVYFESDINVTASLTAGVGGRASVALSIGTNYELGGEVITGSGNGAGFGVDAGESDSATVNVQIPSFSIPSDRWDAMSIYGTDTVLGSITVRESTNFFNYRFYDYIQDYSVQLDAGAAYTLVYEYTAVPEVRSYGFIVGMLSLLAVARRRRV